MASKQALQPTSETKRPAFVEFEKLFGQMREFTESIAHRAYEFFEARGREWGHDLEDWFRAESELIRHVPVEIRDTEQSLIVRAEVPGFAANDIKISVEQRQLMLSGKIEAVTEEKTEQTVYNERRSRQFYRALPLPADVDATQATAALHDGVLELTLPKVAKSAAVQVEVKAG
jgi:HSP20 family protein